MKTVIGRSIRLNWQDTAYYKFAELDIQERYEDGSAAGQKIKLDVADTFGDVTLEDLGRQVLVAIAESM